jgi:hypothetical protein
MASVQHGAAQVKEWDWSSMENFGQDVGKHVGATPEDVWAALMSGDLVRQVQQQSATFMDAAQEYLPSIPIECCFGSRCTQQKQLHSSPVSSLRPLLSR